MKYYESNFDEYVQSVHKYNLHPELDITLSKLPSKIKDLPNMIFYGPSGVGKYSQCLRTLYNYSPSRFKYDRKVSLGNDKGEKKTKNTVKDSTSKTSSSSTKKNSTSSSTGNTSGISTSSKRVDYSYRISDIHYEVDMATLGCNAKSSWHEIFFQIIDIISVKPEKSGIIVCKNFHMIYNELLDIFNSYVCHPFYNIDVRFVIITEQLSFIPNSVLDNFLVVPVKRPSKDKLIEFVKLQNKTVFGQNNNFIMTSTEKDQLSSTLDKIQCNSIINLKELQIMKSIPCEKLPADVFNIITDSIIRKIINPKEIKIQEFRNELYDLLIYNIEITEVLLYIIQFLLENKFIDTVRSSEILTECYTFLKYYNNNYRPIYHLENIIYFIISKIHFNTT